MKALTEFNQDLDNELTLKVRAEQNKQFDLATQYIQIHPSTDKVVDTSAFVKSQHAMNKSLYMRMQLAYLKGRADAQKDMEG